MRMDKPVEEHPAESDMIENFSMMHDVISTLPQVIFVDAGEDQEVLKEESDGEFAPGRHEQFDTEQIEKGREIEAKNIKRDTTHLHI